MAVPARQIEMNSDTEYAFSAPTPVLSLAAPQPSPSGIGVLVINYNTAAQSLRCIESLRQSSLLPDWILVLDNASSEEDFQRLVQGCQAPEVGELHVYRSDENLGFAQGSNALIDLLLHEPSCQQIMLLNNDAVAQKGMLAALSAALQTAGEGAGLAGGRMHKLSDPAQVDTLGIALYASLMPADRKTLEDTYVGPTGGCCMFTRSLLERLIAVSGYYFDPRFFCYCEDTDLVIRAVLLGYQPIYLDQLLALHEGQASSGGSYNPFIAYHGLRNTLWMHVKLVPTGVFWRFGVVLMIAHLIMVVRYTCTGRITLIWNVYRDAYNRLPEFRKERKDFYAHANQHSAALHSRLTRRFYRKGYTSTVWQETFKSKNNFFRHKQ